LSERWAEYGDDCFKAVSLELLADDSTLQQKREAELRWITRLSTDGLLLNKAVISFAPTPEATRKGIEASRHVAGNRWTPEANEKRRLAQIGVPKGHGAKISATKQARKLMR
jgi:tRNA(His) 5'-end guanylyltransferase